MTNNQPTPSAVTDEMVREHYQILKAMNEMGKFVFKQRESKQSDDYERARWHLTEQNKQLANLQAQVDASKKELEKPGDNYTERKLHEIIQNLKQQLLTCQAAMEVKDKAIRFLMVANGKGKVEYATTACAMIAIDANMKADAALSPTSGSELLAKVEKQDAALKQLKTLYPNSEHIQIICDKAITPTTGQSIGEKE